MKMENALDYYIRMLTNINLDTGQIFGIGIIHSWVATATMIYLFILAALIFRARPKAPEYRFMSLLLIPERERQLLDMQAKTLFLDTARVQYLEKWHDEDQKKNRAKLEPTDNNPMTENVAEAMANKIKIDAEQHRKRNISDE